MFKPDRGFCVWFNSLPERFQKCSSKLPASTRLPRPEMRLNGLKMGSISPWFGRRFLVFSSFWNPRTQTFK
jgi:hypothetical protein